MWTYSPIDVGITFAGKPLEGFSDRSFIKIERQDPLYTSKRAMDGTVAVTQQKYSVWKVSLTLAQSSPSNNFLDGVQKLMFDNRMSEMSYLPLIVKDNSGSTMFFAKDVWLDTIPVQEFSNGMTYREWVFSCNDAFSILGGNSEDLDSITEALTAVNVLYGLSKASRSVVSAVGRVFA